MAPTKCQPLTTEYFSVEIYKTKLIYANEIRDLGHLWQRIIRNIATVTQEMLQRTQQDTEYRLDVRTLWIFYCVYETFLSWSTCYN